MRPDILDENWDKEFRKSPYWLRFELGGEIFRNLDQPVPRFIQAFHRAQSVANRLFSQSTPLTVVLAADAESELDLYAPTDDPFNSLKALGFRSSPPWCSWSAPIFPNDDESVIFNWRAIDLSDTTMRDTLIWTSIVYEMEIEPKTPIISYFVDFKTGVQLHIYDDRGMDVHALDRKTIEPLYSEFDAWLLDYDRPRMAKAFESSW